MITTDVAFTVPATAESVAPVRHRVASLAEAAGMSPTVVEDVRLGVTEAVANAVVHAYEDEGGPVQVKVGVDEPRRRLTVVVRDRGRGIASKPGGRQMTGYGLRIIRKLSPRATFVSSPATGTRVRMPFDLDRSALDT